MGDNDALLRSTAAVFGERDRALRMASIEKVYAEDVIFTDPDGSVVGRRALDENIEALLQNAPAEFTFTEDGPLYASGHGGPGLGVRPGGSARSARCRHHDNP